MKHLFWDCIWAKKKWTVVFIFLPAIFEHSLSLKEAILGVNLKSNIVVDYLQKIILLNIWKCRCRDVFSNSKMHLEGEIF